MTASSEKSMANELPPSFFYELAGYKDEFIMCYAPIQAGDYVTLELWKGGTIHNRRVKRICHHHTKSRFTHMCLVASIEFEDDESSK
jgi:hypothetical protein